MLYVLIEEFEFAQMNDLSATLFGDELPNELLDAVISDCKKTFKILI